MSEQLKALECPKLKNSMCWILGEASFSRKEIADLKNQIVEYLKICKFKEERIDAISEENEGLRGDAKEWGGLLKAHKNNVEKDLAEKDKEIAELQKSVKVRGETIKDRIDWEDEREKYIQKLKAELSEAKRVDEGAVIKAIESVSDEVNAEMNKQIGDKPIDIEKDDSHRIELHNTQIQISKFKQRIIRAIAEALRK